MHRNTASASPIISLHDVMPETLPAVHELLHALKAFPPEAVTLLVVPGAGWAGSALDQLRRLYDAGYPFAGHGWRHQCHGPKTWTHKLHSALISRNVAEHLSQPPEAVAALIQHCHDWFGEHGFNVGPLYVPPAWAMGNIPRAALQHLPFRYYETLTGIYDAHDDRFHRLPLIGYEADTPLRACAVRPLNTLNRTWARHAHRPLRIALHPHDLHHHLAQDLRNDLHRAHRTQAEYADGARTG